MTRQSMAIAVRDAASRSAVSRRPSELFALANRLDRLAVVLAALIREDARRILDDETNPRSFHP